MSKKISGVFEYGLEVCTWEGRVIRETAKAVQLDTGHSKGTKVWVPKSQVNGEMVAEWLARKLYQEGKVALCEAIWAGRR